MAVKDLMVKGYDFRSFIVKNVAGVWSFFQLDGTTAAAAWGDAAVAVVGRQKQYFTHDDKTELQTVKADYKSRGEAIQAFLNKTGPSVKSAADDDWYEDNGLDHAAGSSSVMLLTIQIISKNDEGTKHLVNCHLGSRTGSARNIEVEGKKSSNFIMQMNPIAVTDEMGALEIPKGLINDTFVNQGTDDAFATIPVGVNFVQDYFAVKA